MKSSSKSFNSNQSCKNCLRNPQQNSLFVPWKLRAGKQVSPPSTGRVAWLGVIKCIHMNAIKFIVSWSPWWLFRAGNEVQRLRGQMLKGTTRKINTKTFAPVCMVWYGMYVWILGRCPSVLSVASISALSPPEKLTGARIHFSLKRKLHSKLSKEIP